MARCYDCGSTIKGRHTVLCDMVPPGELNNLPAKAAWNQWWDGTDAVDQRSHAQALAECHATPEYKRTMGIGHVCKH